MIKQLKTVRNKCHHTKKEEAICLSPYFSIIYQRPIKYPMEYPHLLIEWGSKCKTPVDLLTIQHCF